MWVILCFLCLLPAYGSQEMGSLLEDEATLPFSMRYKPCFDALECVMDPRVTYVEARSILLPIQDLLEEIVRLQETPLHLRFLIHFGQTFQDEKNRFKAMLINEDKKPEAERDSRYQMWDDYFGALVDVTSSLDFMKRYSIPCNQIGYTKRFTKFLDGLPRTDPFTLPTEMPVALHKLFFLAYTGKLFIELSSIVTDTPIVSQMRLPIPDGIVYDRVALLDGELINLERDGPLPFVQVFDRVQREENLAFQCGALIFDYIRALLLSVRFIDTGDATPALAAVMTEPPVNARAFIEFMMALKAQEENDA